MDAGRYTVLVVEDNGGDARFLRESLEDAFPGRFDLTHVTRLDEALNLSASPKPVPAATARPWAARQPWA